MSRSRRALWTKHLLSGGLRRPKQNCSDAPLQENPCLTANFPNKSTLILGIDSSLRGTGIAVIEFLPVSSQNFKLTSQNPRLKLHFSQTIKIPPKESFSHCLATIFETISELLKKYSIDGIAIEQPIFVQNVRTAQILGAARAAAILPASLAKLPIAEYPPLRIKQAVVGFGKASKEQIAKMVAQILGLPAPLPYDESDAIAVALCHGGTLRLWKG